MSEEMKTAYRNGPGFYAAATSSKRPDLPPNTTRIYCARLEAYDLPLAGDAVDNIEFQLLFAQADGNPEIARALLLLGETIAANREQLQREIG
jgi:hypothetical protein